MKCKACNVTLKDSELVRKDSDGEHLDLCHKCYYSVYSDDNEIGIETVIYSENVLYDRSFSDE